MTAPRVMEPTAADVLAAGAVLWRPGARGVEIALVHRPRYDDWSFPKGKLDADETMPFAAVREIAEETGQQARLGPVLGDVRYTVPDGAKLVRYWAAEARGGEFAPGEETDELRWVDLAHAADMLSYKHDVEVLEQFARIGPPASVIALVRHAKAGSRNQWEGEDALRPLSGSGREQAQQLDPFLRLFGPDRLVSAPPVRCRDTLVPLAGQLDLAIGDEPLFGEAAYGDDQAGALARLRELAEVPGVTVVCSQGGVVPGLVGALATGAHLPGVDPDDLPSKKGSTWLLTFGPGGEVRAADYYERPTG
ncbi:NUDIX hydrolase [Pseudonocardia sichuanensis]|uniref:8-oxo-dGTP diphosphatase n=1 Tax=Pseudonocardia kunmingensis TaxID=630975 RepID=A0A543DZR5_9PSEU|nr:NUDIX domain-containing protein [Pseudonocardia kunmingensis]TQM14837.1 8-oxo-dGTP diphosphatase [Pseudonocardia kunmingensis]